MPLHVSTALCDLLTRAAKRLGGLPSFAEGLFFIYQQDSVRQPRCGAKLEAAGYMQSQDWSYTTRRHNSLTLWLRCDLFLRAVGSSVMIGFGLVLLGDALQQILKAGWKHTLYMESKGHLHVFCVVAI